MSKQRFDSTYRRQAILRQIFLEPQSRADLARNFQSRPNTISDEINRLLEKEIIVAAEIVQTGGRPLSIFRINNDHSYYGGVFLDGEKIFGVILGLGGKIVHRCQVVNAQNIDKEEFVGNIIDVVQDLLGNAPSGKIDLVGISGDYFSTDHRMFLTEYIKNFEAMEIGKIIDRFPQLDFRFFSAVNSRVMAERWFGKGRNTDSFVFINYGAGICASFSFKNIPRHDGYTKIGELGHTRYFSDKQCRCGRKGCLETVASVWAIEDFFRNNEDIIGPEITSTLDTVSLSGVMDIFIDYCLDTKEPRCIKQLEEMTGALAVAVKNLVDLIAPYKIIVGGSLTRARELILPIIDAEVNTLMDPTETTKIPIETSELGEEVGAIGAATFLLSEVFELPESEYFRELL